MTRSTCARSASWSATRARSSRSRFIDVNDPLAPKLNDVEDVERHLPGLLRATNEWFRIYKIPDGKPENQFAFTGECKNKAYAMDVIRECNEAWEKLITGKTQPGNISL
jgi:inorganic pyrophosphatase